MGQSPVPRSSGDSIVVSAVQIDSTEYGSAHALAQRFGRPIFEPTWWPEDALPVTYILDQSPSSDEYRIGSTRRDGMPIVVIGSARRRGGLPIGSWSRPPELEAWQGLIRTVGAHVHAVVHHEQQTIHLIGYASEGEVVRAVNSLRRVAAE
jgi:hypothetical protein